MSGEVTCVRCKANTAVGETTFTANGDYLCRKCTDLADLAVQTERARQEGLRKAGRQRGILSWWLARRAAKKDHAALLASMPDLGARPAGCAKCNGPAPRGSLLCKRCAAASR
jgi:hypothetical protein